MSVWSVEDLEAIGIYEVVVDNDNFKNPSYYINTDQSFNFANDVVTASYGTATPKELDDHTHTSPTGEETLARGLKWNHKQVIINQAYGLLQPNDWYVVRESQAGTANPADWTTFRTDVSSTAADMQSQIAACTTVDELAALSE